MIQVTRTRGKWNGNPSCKITRKNSSIGKNHHPGQCFFYLNRQQSEQSAVLYRHWKSLKCIVFKWLKISARKNNIYAIHIKGMCPIDSAHYTIGVCWSRRGITQETSNESPDQFLITYMLSRGGPDSIVDRYDLLVTWEAV